MGCSCKLCGYILSGYLLDETPDRKIQEAVREIAQTEGKYGLAPLVRRLRNEAILKNENGTGLHSVNPENERTIFVAYWGAAQTDENSHLIPADTSFIVNGQYQEFPHYEGTPEEQFKQALQNDRGRPTIILTTASAVTGRCSIKYGTFDINNEQLQKALGYER
ncbi:MAG: hypothetical protein ACMXYE_00790 [Candidatus Woesearchaeota archaeon]